MKKVLLVITMLFTFFLSPIKADGMPYFQVNATVYDILGERYISDISGIIYISPEDNGKLEFVKSIYEDYGHVYNRSDSEIVGTVDMLGFSNVTFKVQPNSDNWVAYQEYSGETVVVAQSDQMNVINVGNGFEWWSPSSDDTSADLTTIQNYMLVISVLLFMNFLRGR